MMDYIDPSNRTPRDQRNDQEFFDERRKYFKKYMQSGYDPEEEERAKKTNVVKRISVMDKKADRIETIYQQNVQVSNKIFKLNTIGKKQTVFNKKLFNPKIMKNYIPEKPQRTYLQETAAHVSRQLTIQK